MKVLGLSCFLVFLFLFGSFLMPLLAQITELPDLKSNFRQLKRERVPGFGA
jgi:hypothetical protein